MLSQDVLTDRQAALQSMAAEARQHADEAQADIETLQTQLVGDASADANSEYTAALRRLAAAQQTTTEVGAALDRLDDGTYGVCRGLRRHHSRRVDSIYGPIPPLRGLQLRSHRRSGDLRRYRPVLRCGVMEATGGWSP